MTNLCLKQEKIINFQRATFVRNKIFFGNWNKAEIVYIYIYILDEKLV